MDLSTVRTGIQSKLSTITGLKAYATWPDQIAAPCAIVKPSSCEMDSSFDGDNDLIFEVLVLAAPIQNGMVRGQEKLDGYLDDSGTSSVKAAIEAGGAYRVLRWRDYGPHEVPAGTGNVFLAAVFDVLVYS